MKFYMCDIDTFYWRIMYCLHTKHVIQVYCLNIYWIITYAFLSANSAAASFQLGLESGGLGINKQVEGGVEGYIRTIASDT